MATILKKGNGVNKIPLIKIFFDSGNYDISSKKLMSLWRW